MHISINHAILASLTAVLGIATSACSEEKFQEIPDRNELYDRAFIKEFGTPHPDHDWTMATTAGLRVISPKTVNLQVYAEIDDKLYIFANIPGYHGDNAVPVTIPKGIDRLIVVADGIEYHCSPSATLDLSTATLSRGSRDMTIRDPNKKGEYFSITPNSGRTKYITLNLEENPELNQILEDPYNSPYLVTTSSESDWYGGPLMPNVSNLYSPHFSEAQSFDLCWLCVRPRDPSYKNDIYTYLCASTNPFAMQPDTTLQLAFGTSILTSTDNVNWDYNREPSIENGPYVKFSWSNIDINVSQDIYLSFAVRANYSSTRSYTNSRYNYTKWDSEFYDATIKDMNTSYCSTLFYKEVPIKWTRDDETRDDEVAVYAIYYAPHNAAEQRPEKPHIYLLEHHSYGYVQWYQPFYETKDASPYRWRILAEDLGGSYDWDFNDLVVDFTDVITRYVPDYIPDSFIPEETPEGWYYDKENNKYYHVPPYSTLYPKFNDTDLDESLLVREITVTPLASGGTLPIYLGWRGKASASGGPADPDMLLSEYIKTGAEPNMQDGEFIIGCEMHKWLGGTSTGVPINVGEWKTHSGKTTRFYIPANDYPATGGHMPCSSLGFFVIVDPDNTLGADTSAYFDPTAPENDGKPGLTPVNIGNWQDGYTVEMPRVDASSKIPQMFVGINDIFWARESISYADVNPLFMDFVKDPTKIVPTWMMHGNTDTYVKYRK